MDSSLRTSPVHGIFQARILEWVAMPSSREEAIPQVRINISGRNINNLIYTDDTTLMEESEEELTSLLIRVKEE